MIISIDEGKAFNRVQHPFKIKTLTEVGIEGTYLNMMGAICDRSTAYMICSGKGLRAFPLGFRMGWGCPLPPLLFKMLLKVLDTAIGQEKEIKGI